MSRAPVRWRGVAAAVAVALSGAAAAAPPDLRADPAARIFARWAAPNRVPRTTQALAVSTCADDGPGSLRAALAAAAAGATIDLRGLSCGVIQLTTGALQVPAASIRIIGPGAADLAIDGGGTDRVFIDGHDDFALSSLTVRNGANRTTGYHVAGGGCIAAAGTVTLVSSVVSGCLASGEGAYGGALYAYQLDLDDTTFSANRALGYLPGTGTAANGGAIFAYQATIATSTLTGNVATHVEDPSSSSYDVGGAMMLVRGGHLEDSTFDHNVAGDRGGAINTLGDLVVIGSTFAANSAEVGRGGALYLRAPARLTLANTTISDNHAAEGGGAHLASAGTTLVSSIVAGNHATVVAGSDDISAVGTLALGGDHNLVGRGHGTTTLPADTRFGAPNLLPLADNGGPTRTLLPAPFSGAMDAGTNPLGRPFDQRGDGYPRVVGVAADIGAVEAASRATAAVPVPAPGPRWLAWLAAALALFGVRAAAAPGRRC